MASRRGKSVDDYARQRERIISRYYDGRSSGGSARNARVIRAADAALRRAEDLTRTRSWQRNVRGVTSSSSPDDNMNLYDKANSVRYSTSRNAVNARNKRAQGMSAG